MPVKIDAEICSKCEACIPECPEGALQGSGVPIVNLDKCTDCGICIDVCPEEAITHFGNEGEQSSSAAVS